MLTPVFVSCFSIGRSILTLDAPEEIKPDYPVSLFSIAKKHELPEIILVDSSFSGFWRAYEGAKSLKIPLRYGIKFVVCENLETKDDESRQTESKAIIMMRNSAGYEDLGKLYTKSWRDGFYYTNRLDWKSIKAGWTENLELWIPFYDSFIHNNNLANKKCVPLFPVAPTFFREKHDLPFDPLIAAKLEQYANQQGGLVKDVHTIRYYKNEDAIAAQVYRVITGRGHSDKQASINAPNLDNWASDKFSFESYLTANQT